MSYAAEGKLKVIFDEVQVSEKFRKREFVLEIESGMYPEFIKMQLVQDKCSLLDSFQEGQPVRVDFDLRGRPYEKNGETIYFTNISAWRISPAGGEQAASPQAALEAFSSSAPPPNAPGPSSAPPLSASEEDDLPF